jgi:hypothetical protein
MAEVRAGFNVTLNCPLCRQSGFAVWEDGGGEKLDDGKRARQLHVSRGFHPELARTRNGEPLIVCNACDRIQA